MSPADLLWGPLGVGSAPSRCLCVKDHSPEPMGAEQHHIFPLGWGGPKDGETVTLCPTTHTGVHVLLRAGQRHGSWPPPWALVRRFSRFTRHLADEGWSRAEAAGAEPVRLPLYSVQFADGGRVLLSPCARHEAAMVERMFGAVAVAASSPGAVCVLCDRERAG